MKIFYAVLIILAAILAIFGISALAIWVDRKISHKSYDERQNQERGKAYRFSMWVGLVYFLIVLYIQGNELPVAGILLTTGGLMLMLVSFMSYCILTDCYLPMNQRPLGTGIIFLLLGLIQTVNFVIRVDLEPLSLTGRGAFSWVILMLSVMYAAVGCAYLYIAWKERE